MNVDLTINVNFPQLESIMALPQAIQDAITAGFAPVNTSVSALTDSNQALILAANLVLDALRSLRTNPGVNPAEVQASVAAAAASLKTAIDAIASADSAAASTLVP